MSIKYRVYLIKSDGVVVVSLLDDDENSLGFEFDSKQDAERALSKATKIHPNDGRSRTMDKMSGHKFRIDEEYS